MTATLILDSISYSPNPQLAGGAADKVEGDSSKGSSSLDEDGDDVISRLTRGVGGCGLGRLQLLSHGLI